MRFELYYNAEEFQEAALSLLLANEAENNLMLGISGHLARNKFHYSDEEPLMGIVFSEGEPCAAVLRTPPYRLLLTRMALDTPEFLVRQLVSKSISFPAFMGPKESTEAFAIAWTARTGDQTQQVENMRIYQLDKVFPPPPTPGCCVEATADDFALLAQWFTEFREIIHEPPTNISNMVKSYLAEKCCYLWKTDVPVSMAIAVSPTLNGIRIGGVYTPPAFRRHGFAMANVAAISQKMLDAGRCFCFLYTDLANPTSNSIYQKIGYQPICDVDVYDIIAE
jgi:uncharacterized protein